MQVFCEGAEYFSEGLKMEFKGLHKRFRMVLLVGVSAAAIMTASARAEDLNVPQGKFWMELSGVGPFWYASKGEPELGGLKPKYGFMFSGEIGYQFAESPYSIALRVGHGASKKRRKSSSSFSFYATYLGTYVSSGSTMSASTKERLTFIDFEVGRDIGVGDSDARFRLFAGLRFARYKGKDKMGGTSFFRSSGFYSYSQFTGQASRKFTGIGPRVGFNSLTPISESLALRLDAAGALLFGKRKTSAVVNGYYYSSFGGGAFSTVISRRSKSTVVPNLSAFAGLAWTPYTMPNMHVSVGYAVDAYFGITETYAGSKADRIIHGPRLSIRFDF